MPRILPYVFALALVGCSGAGARHLQYDYGRAYSAAVVAQADLTRPSVANLEHPLSGVEAQAIRIRVKESTSDTETGTSSMSVSEGSGASSGGSGGGY
jgi:uncharacterized membrane protein YgcG